MKGIHASHRIRKELFRAFGDPLSSVSGHNLYLASLIRGKLLAELFEYLVAVALAYPNHLIAIHVVNHGDVFMAFFVTGLVNADSAEICHPAGPPIRFKPLECVPEAVSCCSPVDVHVVSNVRFRQPSNQPGNLVVEAFREPACSVRPWDVF